MSVKSLKPNFSHIYLEKGAEEYSLTKLALAKFSKSKIVLIDHYKDFFNRPNQDFQVQKSSMNLILAKKQVLFYTQHLKWFKSMVHLMFFITPLY